MSKQANKKIDTTQIRFNGSSVTCECCKGNLNIENSARRAFYEEGTGKLVFLKGHYIPDGKELAGAFQIDENCDLNICSETPDHNDQCVECSSNNI